MSKILGISCFYHDSAISLIDNGNIIFASQEERFTRKKHDSVFPVNSIKHAIENFNLKFSEIDKIVFYEKPNLKFNRLISTYLNYAPKGINSFMEAATLWLNGKLNQKKILFEEIKKIDEKFDKKNKISFCEHHISHAASAFYPSPFKEAAILTLDGVGEWATTTLGYGNNNDIKIFEELKFPHSLGLLYSAFTNFLGFKVNSGEYKVMGLAPYGDAKYKDIILNNLIDVKDDGSFCLNMKYFDYPVGFKMINKNFEDLFKNKSRIAEKENITQFHMDIAASIQEVTEDILIKIVNYLIKKTGLKKLCLAGGVALNCVANGKLLKKKIIDDIWIQPAAGDAGGSLGCALYEHFKINNNKRDLNINHNFMKGAYLGPSYSDDYVEKKLKEFGADFKKLSYVEIISETVDNLIKKKAIGWFQGRMEFGPRALGNRSIIADPRDENMQKKLNMKVKFRESFRPFAPAILKDKVDNYFNMSKESPYMLLVSELREQLKKPMNDKEKNFFGIDKLNVKRSEIPSVTHVDYTSRIQTVDEKSNKKFYDLIHQFYKKTNCPLIINTSFNIRSEPIVNNPDDAFRCFMGTNLDVLVINNFIMYKENQKKHLIKDYKSNFELD